MERSSWKVGTIKCRHGKHMLNRSLAILKAIVGVHGSPGWAGESTLIESRELGFAI